MAYTFAGGIRLGKSKKARQAMIEKIAEPKIVYLRVGTIGGEPFVPCVKPGDAVLTGEPIAMPQSAAKRLAKKESAAPQLAGEAAEAPAADPALADMTVGDTAFGDAILSDTVSGDAVSGDAVSGDAVSGDAVSGDAGLTNMASDGASVMSAANTFAKKTVNKSAESETEAPDGVTPETAASPAADNGDTSDNDSANEASQTEAALRCGVYASLAGTVLSVKENGKGYTVAIRRGKEQRPYPGMKPYPKPLQKIPQTDIIRYIKKHAISGRDGLTAKKLETAQKNGVRRFIVDLTDPEPSLTHTYRLTMENTEAVLGGIKILLSAVGLRRADIAVEADKRALCRRIRAEKSASMFHVVAVQPKFPQADTRELIAAVYGDAVGMDKDPAKEGYIVFRASECADVYELFAYGTPPIHRVVSVSGDCVGGTRNLLLPVGMPFADIGTAIGGFSKNPVLITGNGTLRGHALSAEDVIDTATQALVFTSSDIRTTAEIPARPCIRCGRCVSFCPARITPYRIAAAVEKKRYAAAKRCGAEACLQCGVCTYVCPSSIPLSSLVREAKHKKSVDTTAKKGKKSKKS